MKRKSLFIFITIVAVAISAVASIIISFSSITIFNLNENQLLYLFSMKGQIVGGVFALTLTAYIFFADKLREIGANNVDYYDATLELRTKYFKDLILIALLVGGTILFCTVGISMIGKYEKVFNFVLNQSALLFFISIGSILFFGITLLNPQKIDNEVRALGKDVESKYPVSSSDESATMEEFITTYNYLEKTIIQSSEKLYGIHFDHESKYGQFKPQIIQALKLLLRYKTITEMEYNELHEIRMYRNSIVHSVDNFQISKSICSRIKELTAKISQTVLAQEQVVKDIEKQLSDI